MERTYRLHSITRRYAEDLLEETERRRTQAQLATWYELYAGNVSHNLADYLEAHRLWRAASNLQQAGELAMGLAERLRLLGLYPLLRELCQTTLNDGRGQDKLLTGMALHQLGMLAQLQGEYEEARQLYKGSLEIEKQLGGGADTLHQLGILAQDQGEYEEAKRLYEESLQISTRLGNQSNRAGTLHQLGALAQRRGKYEEARQLYRENLKVFTQLSNHEGQAISWAQLGVLAYEQGDFENALTNTVQAYILFDALRSPQREMALRMIARIYNQMDEVTFITLWRKAAGGRPLPTLPKVDTTSRQVLQALADFINMSLLQTPAWSESKRLLELHPELLQPEIDVMLQQLALQQESGAKRKAIEESRLLLARCRNQGIEAAFASYLVKQPGILGWITRRGHRGNKT